MKAIKLKIQANISMCDTDDNIDKEENLITLNQHFMAPVFMSNIDRLYDSIEYNLSSFNSNVVFALSEKLEKPRENEDDNYIYDDDEEPAPGTFNALEDDCEDTDIEETEE